MQRPRGITNNVEVFLRQFKIFEEDYIASSFDISQIRKINGLSEWYVPMIIAIEHFGMKITADSI